MDAGDFAIDLAADGADDFSIRPLVRLTIVLVIVNLMGIYEARYVIWGETANARVVNSRPIAGGTQTSIEYTFRDGRNVEHREFEHVPAERQLLAGNDIEVEYIPASEDSARVVGTGRRPLAYVFFTTLIALLICGVLLWRHCYLAVHRPHQPRRRF